MSATSVQPYPQPSDNVPYHERDNAHQANNRKGVHISVGSNSHDELSDITLYSTADPVPFDSIAYQPTIIHVNPAVSISEARQDENLRDRYIAVTLFVIGFFVFPAWPIGFILGARRKDSHARTISKLSCAFCIIYAIVASFATFAGIIVGIVKGKHWWKP